MHDGDAQVLGDVEAHGRQLHRYVGVELPFVDPVEHVHVLLPCPPRLVLVRDTLAEQVERRGDPPGIQGRDGVERLLQCLAGHESAREALRQSIVTNEIEDLRLIRQVEQEIAEHEPSVRTAATAYGNN